MAKIAMTKEEMRKNLEESNQYIHLIKQHVSTFQQKELEKLTGLKKSTISESKSNGMFVKYLGIASVALRKENKRIENDDFQKNRFDRNSKLADIMAAIYFSKTLKNLDIASEATAVHLAHIGKNLGCYFLSTDSYKTLPSKLTIIFDTTATESLTIGVGSDDVANTVTALRQWAKQSRRNFSNYLRLNVTEIASAPPAEMIGSINSDGDVIGYAENDGAYYRLSEFDNDVFQNYCALIEDYDGKPCIPSNQKARVIEFFLVELEDQLTPEIETFLDEKLDEYEHEPDDGQLIDDPFEFLDTLIPDAPAGFADAIEYLRLKNA
jgi:hypothetical protein